MTNCPNCGSEMIQTFASNGTRVYICPNRAYTTQQHGKEYVISCAPPLPQRAPSSSSIPLYPKLNGVTSQLTLTTNTPQQDETDRKLILSDVKDNPKLTMLSKATLKADGTGQVEHLGTATKTDIKRMCKSL